MKMWWHVAWQLETVVSVRDPPLLWSVVGERCWSVLFPDLDLCPARAKVVQCKYTPSAGVRAYRSFVWAKQNVFFPLPLLRVLKRWYVVRWLLRLTSNPPKPPSLSHTLAATEDFASTFPVVGYFVEMRQRKREQKMSCLGASAAALAAKFEWRPIKAAQRRREFLVTNRSIVLLVHSSQLR
jgi:hypothetical protein